MKNKLSNRKLKAIINLSPKDNLVKPLIKQWNDSDLDTRYETLLIFILSILVIVLLSLLSNVGLFILAISVPCGIISIPFIMIDKYTFGPQVTYSPKNTEELIILAKNVNSKFTVNKNIMTFVATIGAAANALNSSKLREYTALCLKYLAESKLARSRADLILNANTDEVKTIQKFYTVITMDNGEYIASLFAHDKQFENERIALIKACKKVSLLLREAYNNEKSGEHAATEIKTVSQISEIKQLFS